MRGAATSGDLRFHVGHRDGREQQRDADAVVEPALHVESLADPPRDARLGHDRLPERGVGRREDHGQDDGFLEAQLTEDPHRRERAERDGQRQSDPEQANRHRRPRGAGARDRSATRRRTARAPASPPRASAPSSSSSRCRSRRAPRARPAARPPRTRSPASPACRSAAAKRRRRRAAPAPRLRGPTSRRAWVSGWRDDRRGLAHARTSSRFAISLTMWHRDQS